VEPDQEFAGFSIGKIFQPLKIALQDGVRANKCLTMPSNQQYSAIHYNLQAMRFKTHHANALHHVQGCTAAWGWA